MKLLWGIDKPQMEACHILFQEEDQESYVETMLDSTTLNGQLAPTI